MFNIWGCVKIKLVEYKVRYKGRSFFKKMIFVYINLENIDQARELGRKIVESGVGGWVDILKTEAMYIDDHKLIDGERVVLIIQTTESKIQELENMVQNLPAKIPCGVVSFLIHRLNREYKDWLVGKTF